MQSAQGLQRARQQFETGFRLIAGNGQFAFQRGTGGEYGAIGVVVRRVRSSCSMKVRWLSQITDTQKVCRGMNQRKADQDWVISARRFIDSCLRVSEPRSEKPRSHKYGQGRRAR